MALETLIKKLEDVPEGLREHYSPVDAEKPEAGFSLGLEGSQEKSRLTEFRTNNINLQKQLTGLETQLKQFEGIDPTKHKKALDALSNLESVQEQQLIADGKIDEVFANRTSTLKQTYEEQLRAKSTAYSELEAKYGTLGTDHAKLLIGGQVQDVMATSKLKPRGTGLRDIMSRVHDTFRMKDGKVVAMEGDQQQFGADGNPLTIAEHISKMASTDTHLFEGSGGGGASGDGSRSGTSQVGGIMIIDPADTVAVGKYLHLVKEGKAKFKTADM